MPRTVWSGAISFGLVNVPVKATVATRDHDIRFVQLHGDDGERIRYQRTCPEHGEVEYADIVKGYPVAENEYVVVTKEELEELEPERSHTIDIEDFVDLSDVDPVYFVKSYHLVPDGPGKAYGLLATAMEESGKVAIGRVVMRAKEHLVALRVWQGSLVMELLRFADEVEAPEPVEAPAPKKREKEMALKLIESLSKTFDPDDYEDLFRARLEEYLHAKAEGKTVKTSKADKGTVIEDLEAALERSLAEVAG